MRDLKIEPPPPMPVAAVEPPAPAIEEIAAPGTLPDRPTIATGRTVLLGHSVKGVPIVMHVFGQGADAIFIFGGIHGSEPGSAELAHELVAQLRADGQISRQTTVAVLPEANPDGLAAGTRTNANGVDLNRNFPARNWRAIRDAAFTTGCAPASEPETKAIIAAMEMIRPSRVISIHSALPGRHCNNYDGPAEALTLASMMAALNNYPVKASIGYPTPGSFGSWAGIDSRIATITLELPADLRGSRTWHVNGNALLTAIALETPTVGK